MSRMATFLYRPVDVAPLVVFRIMMGLLMAAEGFGAILTGWVRANYVEVPFTFPFIGFEFLQVLVGPQAYAVYALLGFAGLGVAFGYRYRLSIAIYTLLWAAVYFGQKTSYNNHYYLLLLMSLLLWIAPLHRAHSADVRSGRVEARLAFPFWQKWVFKVLLLIVYTYAAIAKLYPDWLDGTAVGLFLSGKCHYPIVGPLCDERWFILLISYGGIVFDFLVVPGLWYRRTRVIAFVFSLFFHLFNSLVFQIGIFPYMMLICTVLYFDEASIRRLFFRKRPLWNFKPMGLILPPATQRPLLEAFLIVFLLLMILLPLRPFYFPGSPHWSEEGHRLSWHMMLRSKSGYLSYELRGEGDELLQKVFPPQVLPAKMARSMATRPDKIWQYAQRLADDYEAEHGLRPKVYAIGRVSLNGRTPQPLIDPEVNLAELPWNPYRHHRWILPHPEL